LDGILRPNSNSSLTRDSVQAECAMYYWSAEETYLFEVFLQCFDLSQTSLTAVLRLAVGRWVLERIGAGKRLLASIRIPAYGEEETSSISLYLRLSEPCTKRGWCDHTNDGWLSATMQTYDPRFPQCRYSHGCNCAVVPLYRVTIDNAKQQSQRCFVFALPSTTAIPRSANVKYGRSNRLKVLSPSNLSGC
jgi:hypothetical protein